jgi:hypothetical protein
VAERVTSAIYASTRSTLRIPTLDDSVTKTVVTDAGVCNAMRRAVYRNLESVWKLPADADRTAILASLSIHYFRVGDYVAAMLMDNGKNDGPLAGPAGWAPVMIFESSSLRYVGDFHA